jgi:hypothetical protein
MDNCKAVTIETQEGFDSTKSKLNKLTSQVELLK